MKLKKYLSVTLCAALVLLLLAGCGADSGGAKYDAYDAEVGGIYENGSAADGTPAEDAAVETSVESGQKLVKTVYMSAETEDLTTLLDGLEEQITRLGGYVEVRNVYNGSAYSASRSRNADLTIRIPANNLDGFVGQIEGMSNIISSNETVEDITLNYVAVESRMDALQTEQERLLELMAQAQTMSDLLEVEARLTEVVSELESVTSQLRVMDNMVDYATVELSIREVQTLTVVEEETVWQRMTRGFAQNLKNLGNALVELAIFIVVSLPFLVPLGAITALVVVLVRRSRKRRKLPENPPFPVENNTPEQKE